MSEVGSFIVDQMLKMEWLNGLIADLLSRIGVDKASRAERSSSGSAWRTRSGSWRGAEPRRSPGRMPRRPSATASGSHCPPPPTRAAGCSRSSSSAWASARSSTTGSPQPIIEAVLGDGNPFSVVLATLVGAPVYADIFGTLPIAEALYAKGVGLGTLLAFMMSVTVLSIPSLTMLARVVKPRLLATFVGVCLIGMIASGYLFNALQPLFV